MSSRYAIGNERLDGEQSSDHEAVWESGPAVDKQVEQRASVEQERQAGVDTNHPDAQKLGEDSNEHLTLIQEERIEAAEWELDRISAKAEFGRQEDRERRTRKAAEQQVGGRRERLRTGYEDDPREHLTKAELAEVHQRATEIEATLTFAGQHRAIARHIAERVVHDRECVLDAALHTKETLLASRGVVKPIARVEPSQWSVTVEGTVVKLFEPASPSQQQVGILEDDSESIKLTVWQSAAVGTVLHEGDQMRIHDASPGRYNGQTTLAAERKSRYGTVYKQTRITILDQGDGPAPRRPRVGPVYDEDGNVVQDPKPCAMPAGSTSSTGAGQDDEGP